MKTKTGFRRKRPDALSNKKITDLKEENKASLHKIDRRKVSIHSAGDGSGESDGELGGIFTPTTEQVAKINAFTKKSVTADEVIAFSTNSLNDLWDRDDEAFTKQTVDDFAALEQPFSFVGKSYMADHGRSIKDIRGRIFDVGTKTTKGVHFLTNDIYIPKTPQHADFIENIEFGLNWAVSVGVVVDKSECSICKAPVYTSSWSGWAWCDEGHEKGFYYIPGQETDDGWGFFVPVDPSTKGAVKAQVWLKDPIDAYELSQVFLGAQLFAQIGDKTPSIKSAVRRADKKNIPIVGLSAKEAEGLTIPREPKEVTEARKLFEVSEEDGVLKWVDAKGIGWQFDPETDNKTVLCLGAAEDPEDEDEDEPGDEDADDEDSEGDEDEDSDEDDELGSHDDSEDPSGDTEGNGPAGDHVEQQPAAANSNVSAKLMKFSLVRQLIALKDAVAAAEVDDPEDTAEIAQAIDGTIDALDVLADDLLEALGLSEDDEDGSAEMSPVAASVLKVAVASKLPRSIIDKLADTDDETALSVAFSEVAKQLKTNSKLIKELEPKAALGDQFVQEAEKTALHWFTVSRRDPKEPEKGVNVELAQKLIKLANGDIETLKGLADDWKQEAAKKFPSAARRSTVPEDLTEVKELAEVPMDKDQAEKIRKLHG